MSQKNFITKIKFEYLGIPLETNFNELNYIRNKIRSIVKKQLSYIKLNTTEYWEKVRNVQFCYCRNKNIRQFY